MDLKIFVESQNGHDINFFLTADQMNLNHRTKLQKYGQIHT